MKPELKPFYVEATAWTLGVYFLVHALMYAVRTNRAARLLWAAGVAIGHVIVHLACLIGLLLVGAVLDTKLTTPPRNPPDRIRDPSIRRPAPQLH